MEEDDISKIAEELKDAGSTDVTEGLINMLNFDKFPLIIFPKFV